MDDPFSLDPTNPGPSSGAVASLPFNLESGLGGVDATLAMFAESAIRTGLFDFGTGGANRIVRWPSVAMSMDQNAQATVRVPDCLNFDWSSGDVSITVAGETKASFQRNLVQTCTSGLNVGGFGMEFQRTFKENHYEETFEKYVAMYERAKVYKVEFNDDPKKFLSAKAKADFDTLSPAAIVDKYGTHYMHMAIFGGARIFSSRLDIRDEVNETDLSTAMQMSMTATDPESGITGTASGGASNSDHRVNKLHQAMSVTKAESLGGTEGEHRTDWIHSLYSNPSVIGYQLMPIADLISNPAASAAVAKECAARFQAQQVTNTYTLLAMMVPIEAYTTDLGSHAGADLSVGRPKDVPGWYYIGQWGIPASGGFPSGYQAFIFRGVPGATGAPAIKSCTGLTRRWGKSSSYGLYAPVAPAGYVAIGDLYESTDNPGYVTKLDFYGCVRADLVTASGGWDNNALWTDQGSRASENGSAWSFEAYDRRDTADTQRMILVPGGGREARLFKVASGYAKPAVAPVKVKWDGIRMLTNNFILN